MHKIAIAQATTDRLKKRLGKLHPFDAIDPRKTALVVVDMQNYFVKQGHQSEIPGAREIVPNINRLATEVRRRGGHVVWVRNGTNTRGRAGQTTTIICRAPTAPSAA